MDIPFLRWYPAIEKRRSRRRFDASRPIESDKLSDLDTVCKRFMPFPNVRSYLVAESVKDVFKGIVGSYGKVKGAPAFIAFIGKMDSDFVQEEVGYTAEGIMIEATSLSLNTCWVAGFFKPESVASLVEIKSNERVLAVTPVGYAKRFESLEEKLMTSFGRTHRRLPISKLTGGLGHNELPEWARTSTAATHPASIISTNTNIPSTAFNQPVTPAKNHRSGLV